MNKAYSIFEIKSLSEETRTIGGIATTITPDRMNDIVEARGAKFNLPLPLLSQHDHHLPIGTIHVAKVTDGQIEIEAEIAKDTGLEYVETAYKQIKHGLVRGLSIGFRALDYDFIKDSDGIRFKQWEMLEVSAVTIPANSEAAITVIRSYDSDPSKRSEVIHALSETNPRVEQAIERIKRAKAALDYRKK
jgi:HK97 family phage prohead protease